MINDECNAFSGAHSRGDDITGLSRAFLYAGAPAVISSLWYVDDRATSDLMTSFYKRIIAYFGAADDF
jgi:CHAT domain-containing protein